MQQRARAQEPPWNDSTCMAAAKGGQLALLQQRAWAKEPPCPWDVDAIQNSELIFPQVLEWVGRCIMNVVS